MIYWLLFLSGIWCLEIFLVSRVVENRSSLGYKIFRGSAEFFVPLFIASGVFSFLQFQLSFTSSNFNQKPLEFISSFENQLIAFQEFFEFFKLEALTQLGILIGLIFIGCCSPIISALKLTRAFQGYSKLIGRIYILITLFCCFTFLGNGFYSYANGARARIKDKADEVVRALASYQGIVQDHISLATVKKIIEDQPLEELFDEIDTVSFVINRPRYNEKYKGNPQEFPTDPPPDPPPGFKKNIDRFVRINSVWNNDLAKITKIIEEQREAAKRVSSEKKPAETPLPELKVVDALKAGISLNDLNRVKRDFNEQQKEAIKNFENELKSSRSPPKSFISEMAKTVSGKLLDVAVSNTLFSKNLDPLIVMGEGFGPISEIVGMFFGKSFVSPINDFISGEAGKYVEESLRGFKEKPKSLPLKPINEFIAGSTLLQTISDKFKRQQNQFRSLINEININLYETPSTYFRVLSDLRSDFQHNWKENIIQKVELGLADSRKLEGLKQKILADIETKSGSKEKIVSMKNYSRELFGKEQGLGAKQILGNLAEFEKKYAFGNELASVARDYGKKTISADLDLLVMAEEKIMQSPEKNTVSKRRPVRRTLKRRRLPGSGKEKAKVKENSGRRLWDDRFELQKRKTILYQQVMQLRKTNARVGELFNEIMNDSNSIIEFLDIIEEKGLFNDKLHHELMEKVNSKATIDSLYASLGVDPFKTREMRATIEAYSSILKELGKGDRLKDLIEIKRPFNYLGLKRLSDFPELVKFITEHPELTGMLIARLSEKNNSYNPYVGSGNHFPRVNRGYDRFSDLSTYRSNTPPERSFLPRWLKSLKGR